MHTFNYDCVITEVYIKTYKTVHVKHMQFSVYQIFLNKAKILKNRLYNLTFICINLYMLQNLMEWCKMGCILW